MARKMAACELQTLVRAAGQTPITEIPDELLTTKASSSGRIERSRPNATSG